MLLVPKWCVFLFGRFVTYKKRGAPAASYNAFPFFEESSILSKDSWIFFRQGSSFHRVLAAIYSSLRLNASIRRFFCSLVPHFFDDSAAPVAFFLCLDSMFGSAFNLRRSFTPSTLHFMANIYNAVWRLPFNRSSTFAPFCCNSSANRTDSFNGLWFERTRFISKAKGWTGAPESSVPFSLGLAPRSKSCCTAERSLLSKASTKAVWLCGQFADFASSPRHATKHASTTLHSHNSSDQKIWFQSHNWQQQKTGARAARPLKALIVVSQSWHWHSSCCLSRWCVLLLFFSIFS